MGGAVNLSSWVKEEAQSLGFSLCGISGELSRGRAEFHEWWLNQGFGANMFYLRRKKSLGSILPGARAAVVCALRFPGGAVVDGGDGASGKIARYALNEDYHDRLLPMLEELGRRLDEKAGVEGSLAYVDTGPLNERALAAQAGIGWIGKNAMLIHPEEGSWFWLGEVITRAPLVADEPMADHCGKCRRCVDACPTGAIIEGLRTVDSKKCLSYWNIEHRGPIPAEFQGKMGDWLLGCDICQEVCPWNEHSLRKARVDVGAPPLEYLPLAEILGLDEEGFKKRFRGRAVSRAKRAGLQRNAEIVERNKTKVPSPD